LSIFYLHGFASGPNSQKARFFAGKLASLGVSTEVPDLTEGNFERFTLGRQLKFIEEQMGEEPATLIGSSLGGYLAALFAARSPKVRKLVLLAPAFGFYDLWIAELGPERLESWKRNGTATVFHYGLGREAQLSFMFLEDAKNFEPFPHVVQPTLIFHGDRDPLVPVAQSIEFVRLNPQARLVRFKESGHELTDVLDNIWTESQNFLLEGPCFSSSKQAKR
jgi:uncharacterized protein